jgi:hypothetical protein
MTVTVAGLVRLPVVLARAAGGPRVRRAAVALVRDGLALPLTPALWLVVVVLVVVAAAPHGFGALGGLPRYELAAGLGALACWLLWRADRAPRDRR